MSKLIFLSLILIFFLNEEASANCNGFQVILNPTSYAFSTTFDAPIQMNINISKQNAAACTYFLTFSKGSAGSYDRKLFNMAFFLPYQIYQISPNINILKDLPEANTVDQVIQRTMQISSRTDVVQYYLNMPAPTAYSPYGLYTDSILVSAYEGVIGGGGPLLATQTLFLNYAMPKQVDLAIVPPGGSFDIGSVFYNLDFGILETGETQGFDVVAKYNAGYALYIASTHSGSMKNTAGNIFILYTLKVNGVPIDLSGGLGTPVLISSGGGSSPSQGIRFSGALTVGAVEDKLSGSYSDSLQLSIVSIE